METIEMFRTALRYCLDNSEYPNQRAVAKAAGVSPSVLSEILKKKSYGPKTQAKIAMAFDLDIFEFLALGRRLLEAGEPSPVSFAANMLPTPDDETAYKGIAVYASGKLAAGAKGMIFDPFEEPASSLMLSEQELTGRRNHHLVGLNVGGLSMSPLIPQGSIVIVDMDDQEMINNRVYAVNYPSEGENIAAVKRVQTWDEGFVLISSNPDYPPELTRLDWRDLCLGRAIWVWKRLEDL